MLFFNKKSSKKSSFVCRRKLKNSSGFTITEMVAAVSILAFMLTMMYTIVLKILNITAILDDSRTLLALSENILNRAVFEIQLAHYDQGSVGILNTFSRSSGAVGTGRTVHFKGESNQGSLPGSQADSLTFLALEAGQFVSGQTINNGLVQISYRLHPNQDSQTGFSLVREEMSRSLPEKKAIEKRLVFPISDNVVSLDFRYYDTNSKSWSNEWGNKNSGLPGLVEINVILESPQKTRKRYATTVALKSSRS
jgi:type II secretory pathway pseudopilin PulG